MKDDDDLRPHVFGLAYRMLGSASDAEDVVQEAYLRLHRSRSDGAEIASPRGFLTTVATRVAIDHLRSAQVRRETYFGPWLPEPLLTSTKTDGARVAEMADSLSLSFLVLLETLSPVERAVFLLREVFDYGYDEIAGIVDRNEANCRQIFVRARRHIDEGRPRFEATRAEQEELADRFFDAVQEGELDGLVDLLAADVVFQGDGGGKANGLLKPIHGRAKVGRLLRKGIFGRYAEFGLTLERTEVNGQPGALCLDPSGAVVNVFSLEIADGAIQTVRSVINPDKLGHLGRRVSELARTDRRE